MSEKYFLSNVVEAASKTTLSDFLLKCHAGDVGETIAPNFIGKQEDIREVVAAKTYDSSVSAISDAYYAHKIDTFTTRLIEDLPVQSRAPFILTAQTHVTKATPLKVFALAKGLGLPEEKARNLAGTVDALFLLSLMIDDIKDADTTRNGEKTAWSEFGIKRTVKAIHDVSDTILTSVERDFGYPSSKMCKTDCEIGLRSLEDQRAFTPEFSVKALVHDWDKRLFFVSHFPVFACAQLMRSSNTETKYMAAYRSLQLTMRVGQLCNDLNDFSENRFSDWKNGCTTLPIKMLFQRAQPELRYKLQACFGQGDIDKEKKKQVLRAFKQLQIGKDLVGYVFAMHEKSQKNFLLVAPKEFGTLIEEWMQYKRRGLQKADIEI